MVDMNYQQQRPSHYCRLGLAALFGALASILFRTGGSTALQADALAAPAGVQLHAWQWLRRWSGFTVCFGNDLVAHVNFPDKLKN
jgi:hypothetical protein